MTKPLVAKHLVKERLLKAYQILDGIPEEVIQLDAWRAQKGTSLSCGTIACGGGWLSMHPYFNELGLKLENGWPTVEIPNHWRDKTGDDAMDHIFGARAFNRMFDTYGGGTWDKQLLRKKPNMTHKELLLARISKAYHGIN